MQRNKKFNKKKAVRFVLVPGRDQNGNPVNMFKPVETRNKLTSNDKRKAYSQLSDFPDFPFQQGTSDYQIEIDGKKVDQSDIPSFILQQIKGRADLVYTQQNPHAFQGLGEEQQEEGMMEEQQWFDEGEGQLIPQDQYMNYQEPIEPQNVKMTKNRKPIQQQTDASNAPQKQSESNQLKQVEIDGKSYTLTSSQLSLLQQVLPQNYQNYTIKGVQFVKYDEDGNRLDQKQKYKKYIAQPVQRRGIIDSFDYVPQKPVNIIDNDLQGVQLKGDMKDVEEALNYEGEDEAYEELEDDFFSKLISHQQPKNQDKKENKSAEAFKKKKDYVELVENIKQVKQQKSKIASHTKLPQKQKKPMKFDQLDGDDEQMQEYQDDDQQQYEEQDYDQDEQITDEMIDKALEQFDRKKQSYSQQNSKQAEIARIPGTGVPIDKKGMSLIKFIESREQCIGKDGELDWRTLTKKQKKEYMKNKKIRQIYQEVREKQITQKLQGKINVKPQQLHLKQYIEHIPYNEDHVMQEAIKRNEQQVVDINNIEDDQNFETDSDQDDIISYRAKTSIISSNLATVEEPAKKKNKVKQQKEKQDEGFKNIQKIKVIPEKRNKNQTKQERKQRKQKLKDMKKQKKQQKKQFSQVFENERKKALKQTNTSSNPLHKVSFVKII